MGGVPVDKGLMEGAQMKKNRNIPAASIVLVIAAVLVVAAGTAFAAVMKPGILSEDYKSEFRLSRAELVPVENGVEMSGRKDAQLLSECGGVMTPGRIYSEELSLKNKGEAGIYVRAEIYAYWVDEDGEKRIDLDPSMIELSYGEDSYNRSAWQEDESARTAERRVFYYTDPLGEGEAAEPVVDGVRVSGRVAKDVVRTSEKKDGVTVYTYKYRYDGCRVCLEADMQAVQAHNAADAVRSVWGVTNVTVSGGRLVVR